MKDPMDFRFASFWPVLSYITAVMAVVLIVLNVSTRKSYEFSIIWVLVTVISVLQGIKTSSDPAIRVTENEVSLYMGPIRSRKIIYIATIANVKRYGNNLKMELKTGKKESFSLLWLNKEDRDIAVQSIEASIKF